MKVDLSDEQVLCAVSPDALATFAKLSGWTKRGDTGEYSDVYMKTSGATVEVPNTEKSDDYAFDVHHVINVFSKLEGISPDSLYKQLFTLDRDQIQFRVTSDEVNGSIKLKDSRQFVDGVWDIFETIANRLKKTLQLKKKDDLLEDMRMGHTELGSFVWTFMTPQIPMDRSNELLTPPPRHLSERLADALSATRKATDSNDLNAFSQKVATSAGVDAQWCEKLSNIVAPFAKLSVQMDWARTLPNDFDYKPVSFAQKDVQVIREAATFLKDREKEDLQSLPNQKMRGFVHRLDRDEENPEGTIRIKLFVDGEILDAKTILGASDFDKASRANNARKTIVVHGRLRQLSKRGWQLENPKLEDYVSHEPNTHPVELLAPATQHIDT